MKIWYFVFAISLLPVLNGATGQSAQAQTAANTPPPAASQPLRIRKDWEELTPAEKAAFTHAIDVLKKKSRANIFDRTGFIWQAWVHNCTTVRVPSSRSISMTEDAFRKLLDNNTYDSCDPRNFVAMPDSPTPHMESPGECEHRKDIFLPWHRAELWFFEQALRAADPTGASGPSTKDVTLPYWNFTRKPSGKRYPKEFEDPSSPLYDKTRYADPLPSSMRTSSPYLLAYLIYFDDWARFGGDSRGGLGQGDLESKIHNRMHGDYIGGHMGDNTRAGMDPIFYLFHNFLDYSLEKWIQAHGIDKIPAGDVRTNYMRAQQDQSLGVPANYNDGGGDPLQPWGSYLRNMGQSELYLDAAKVGYAFKDTDKDNQPQIIPKAEISALIEQHTAFAFGGNAISLMSALLSNGLNGPSANPDIKLTGRFLVPKEKIPANSIATLQFTRADVMPDYTFCAEVYLYPEGTKENIQDLNFRNRWLVASTAHWGLAHDHTPSIDLHDEVTGIVNSLVPAKSGTAWILTAAVSRCGGNKAPNANDFSAPFITVEQR